jgi:ATP-binding cassette subfamily B protein
VPFSFRYLVDSALIKHDGAALLRVLSLLGSGAVLVTVIGLWRDKLFALVQTDVIARIRAEMFTQLQRLALDFYARHKRAEIMLHFKKNLGLLESYATALVARAILPLLKILTSGVLMYVVDWRLGLASTVLLPLTYIGPRKYSPRVMAEFSNRKIQEGQVEDVVKECVGAQPLVKAYGLQTKYLVDFRLRNETLTQTSVLHSYYAALVRRTVGIGSLLSLVAVMGIGAYMVWNDLLSIGSFAAFQALFVGLNYALADFMQNLPAMMQARDGLIAIDKLLREVPLVADRADALECGPLAQGITFRDVAFGYAPEQTLIAGVTFSIAKGASVAVVGTNGSGKSTILSLLERFYDPRTGGISYDGQDLRQLTQASVRRRIGAVFQDPVLLEMSVSENIRCGKLNASGEEIVAAAKRAGVHDAIVALPNGYDTVVTERTKLSHLQRQRLSLARALIRKPDILVLDEVTSMLDQQAEAAFAETTARLRSEMTVLEVSGRLATTVGMDRIIVMDQGRIVEQGTHAELAARHGAYRALWDKQTGFTFSDDGEEARITTDRLRAIPIFATLSTPQLEEVAAYVASESVAADRVVVQEGDLGEHFYIIVRGLVDVTKHVDEETELHVATLEGGDYFGELALLSNAPRTATVRTLAPTMFLVLHRSHFARLLDTAPGMKESLESTQRHRAEAEQQMRAQRGIGDGVRRPTRTAREGLRQVADFAEPE